MKGESFLVAVAQIGIMLGGFAGFVSMFRQTGREWIPQEIEGIKLIIQCTFGTTCFALLPFPLFFMLEVETAVWRTSSFFLACFLAFEILLQRAKVKKLTGMGAPPRGPMVLFFFIPTSILFIAQLLNTFRWSSIAALAWGLLYLLVAAGIQLFNFLIHFRLDSNKENSQPKTVAKEESVVVNTERS